MTKLKKDFKALREHCIIIKRDFDTYNNLYFSGNDKILEKSAVRFFNDISEILRRDWILQVCKLMDPAFPSRKKKNLENISIDLINEQLKEQGIFNQEIEGVSILLEKYGNKLLPARNKQLAHFDRECHVSGVGLGDTTENELEEFILNIQKYCDLVGIKIGVGPLDFSRGGCRGDVYDLLKVLSKGIGKTKLKKDFEAIREHCIIIKRDFNTYNNLYFSGNDKILEKSAVRFFNDISEILRRDWILQVCKLMDPAFSSGKRKTLENISIDLINEQLKEQGIFNPEIEGVSILLEKYGNKLLPARNKILAHFDRECHVSGVGLGGTTMEEVEGFILNIQKYCDLVGIEIGVGPLDFPRGGCRGDVYDLLKVLSKGMGK